MPCFIGDSAGLSDLWIAILEVSLALVLAIGIFARKGCSSARAPSSTRCSRSRYAMIADIAEPRLLGSA